MINIEKISLIGLGKLGLPLLSTFAVNGQEIIGYDIDQNKINELKENKLPFFEPNLDNYFNVGKKNIDLTNDIKKIIEKSDAAIILVNTPSDINGEFSNQNVFNVVEALSKELKNSKKEDFLFIISSTVMPNSHKQIIKIIESNSEKKLNHGFGYAYIPDLVALGSVINDFENPDLLILGASNEYYGNVCEKIYHKIIKNEAPIKKMSIIESEVTKVSLNAYITMKISFANFIGNIADIFGCNSNNITEALGCDRRISSHYIKSGVSFGGTCFPRDTWAFIKMAENIGLDALHIKATQKINESQNQILFDKVKKHKDKRIGIWGLAFKPNTAVINESPGMILYNNLKKYNCSVFGCDEFVETDYNYNNLKEFIDNCDVIVITQNIPKVVKNFKTEIRNKIIINPWNLDLN